MCSTILKKVMIWWKNGVQKYNRHGILDEINEECMLYIHRKVSGGGGVVPLSIALVYLKIDSAALALVNKYQSIT